MLEDYWKHITAGVTLVLLVIVSGMYGCLLLHRRRADGRRRVHEASAAHIRATWGTSVAEGESR